MVTKEQAQSKISLEKSRATLIKKARGKRENWIMFGWILEIISFVMFGALYAYGYFLFPLRLIAWIFLAIGLYLSFDVGNKIERNAILNYQNGTRK